MYFLHFKIGNTRERIIQYFSLFQRQIVCTRITLESMAVETNNTKNISNFMLNHVLYYHFSEKQPSKKLIQLLIKRHSMFLADVAPIKTKSFGTGQSS